MFKPELIEKEAKSMENHASQVLALWAILGFLAAAGTFVALRRTTEMALVVAFLPAIICVAIGEGKARQFRYQAQLLRLQLQIECNTRYLAEIYEAFKLRL